MSELSPQGSKYTDDQRKECAVLYAIKGSFSAVSRETGIPCRTVTDWQNTDWWDALVAEVRHEKADEHIAKYTALVSDAIDYAHANLDKASPKDALIMAATATDKARLLMNQPTSISGKSSDLTQLAQRFAQIERDHQAITNSVVSTIDSHSNK